MAQGFEATRIFERPRFVTGFPTSEFICVVRALLRQSFDLDRSRCQPDEAMWDAARSYAKGKAFQAKAVRLGNLILGSEV